MNYFAVASVTLEIRGCAVGKSWTASFVHWHKDELKSLYSKRIDIKRVKGESDVRRIAIHGQDILWARISWSQSTT
jgi:hypothetical protein